MSMGSVASLMATLSPLAFSMPALSPSTSSMAALSSLASSMAALSPLALAISMAPLRSMAPLTLRKDTYICFLFFL
jgi:hypothetical protein